MEGGDAEAKAPRAGRRARQAQLVQEEQVVGSTDEGSHAQQDRETPSKSQPVQHALNNLAGDTAEGEGPPQPAGPRRQGFADPGPGTPPAAGALVPAPPPSQPVVDPLGPDAEAGLGKKFTGVSRRKQEQALQAQEEQTKAKSKYEDRARPDNMMEIPELEEEGKEDLSNVVAAAPKVRANRIQGIEELDEDSQYRLPATQNRDLDLSILTAVLLASDMVHEPDEVWNHDLLLSQVAAEMNADRERGTEPEGKLSDPNMMMAM